MEGIDEMFAELAEHAECEAQLTLEWWLRTRRRANNEASRDLERRRYALDVQYRQRKLTNQKRRYAEDPAFREAHRARMREYMRRRAAQKKIAAEQQRAA